MSRLGLARALALGATCLAASGCVTDRDPVDAGPEDAGDETPCGAGPIAITLGVDNPFEPRPDHRFPIEQGLQGGYHIDISLRARGALDPDDVDIQIDLVDGDTRIARHLTTGWLLHIDPDGPACEYPRARLVLVDGEGGLLPAERVDGLVGRPLALTVYLRSPLGDADAAFEITPSEVDRYR